MPPPLAPLSALEIRLGLDTNSLSGADRKRAEAALADASSLVRGEARRDFVDDDGVITAPEAVLRVVLGAALRTYRNPDSVLQESVGPFSRTRKRADTGTYLTEPELAIVRRYRLHASGLWTQRTTKLSDDDTTVWIDDSYGFEPFPIGTVDE